MLIQVLGALALFAASAILGAMIKRRTLERVSDRVLTAIERVQERVLAAPLVALVTAGSFAAALIHILLPWVYGALAGLVVLTLMIGGPRAWALFDVPVIITFAAAQVGFWAAYLIYGDPGQYSEGLNTTITHLED